VAAREGHDVDVLSAWAQMGFAADKLDHIGRELPTVTRLLLRPFLGEEAFDPDTWHLSRDLESLLGVRRWWFRSAGPADVFLLLRAFHGLCGQLRALDVRLPWWPLLESQVSRASQQAARVWTPPVRAYGSYVGPRLQDAARTLEVLVVRVGGERIELTFPSEVALDLESIVPAEVQARLAERGPTLASVSARVRSSGLAPQHLFELSHEGNHYRVRLK
jgi:hypothetical protein